MSKHTSPTVVFVADTHFPLRPGPDDIARQERFLEFLDHTHAADHLVLLGDIFDFWFDYPHFRLKGYEEILNRLDAVRDSGTQLHFIGGNHDIWAADYFRSRYGCDSHGETLDLPFGDRMFRLDHGDGMLAKDYIYKSFRWLVRQRAGVLFAKSLHPEILYTFSRWLSTTSRKAYRHERKQIEQLAEAYLDRNTESWDHAFKLVKGERIMMGLGCWMGEEGFATLRDGDLQLHDFREGFPAFPHQD
jgi:UDP-2,3-diacylglucosamine hydrolase